MHTCTHMKTNTATVQHAVESLTLAHKQPSVQPSSPSPQTLACLNLAVRLISSLSTPTGLADAQLTAAFIRTYRVGVQLSRPLRSQLHRRGISVETAQRVETTHPKSKIRLGCRCSGVRHLLGNTWHESSPELSQLFGWSVSTMDRDQAWPLPPHRPIAQTRGKHWKGTEAARGTFVKDAFTWGGGTGNTGWGSSRNATMAGCYAREDAQSSTHPYSSGKLISTFFPTMKQLVSLFPIFFEIKCTGENFLGQGLLLSQFAEQSSIQPFI